MTKDELSDWSSASFVLACSTTIRQAKNVHEVGARFLPGLALQARSSEKWHYGSDYGFTYAELDSDEPIQEALRQIFNDREIQNAKFCSEASIFGAQYSIEPLPIILIVIGAVGAGVAQEIGKDLWTGVKNGMAGLWRRMRRPDEQPVSYARLYEELSRLHGEGGPYNPVVLLQIAHVRLTFVVEPGLSEKAIRQAERLIAKPKPNLMDRPLRWDRHLRRWLPDESAIFNEDGLRSLQRDVDRLARPNLEAP